MTIEEKSNVQAIADKLHEQFGSKDTINAEEFAEYLGLCRQVVCNSINARVLPGQKIGGKFIIPIHSIALWEYRISKVKDIQGY